MRTIAFGADSLSEIVPSLNGSLAHPISQVSLSLGMQAAAFAMAQCEILKWMSDRAGRPLPDSAWKGEPFELEEIGAQHVEAVAIDRPRFWAARLDDADKTVPSRSWVTEVALGQDESGNVVFGCRLTAVVRGPRVPFERSIPGFIRAVVRATGASLNARMISERPWLITTESDVKSLVKLINLKARTNDVIVASSGNTLPHRIDCAVNVFDIIRKTLGIAQVAVLSPAASEWLAEKVGREFSVSHQAVRVYRPGFNEDLDEPFAHPLALAREIMTWRGIGPAEYIKTVVSKALAKSVAHEEAEKVVPSFLTVKQAAARLRVYNAAKSDRSDNELIKLYEKENEALRKQLEIQKSESDSLLILAERERDEALALSQQAQENGRHLRLRIGNMEEQILRGIGNTQDIPETLDRAKDWCERHLSGSVLLHSRAYRGLKDSIYHDVSFIYRVLLMVRDFYVPMRREGGEDLMARFQQKCSELGISEESTGSESRAGEQGEEYFVKYGGQRVFLDRHLKKGNSREARNCFRAYFFWDEVSQQVVVGWLPSHLDSRIT